MAASGFITAGTVAVLLLLVPFSANAQEAGNSIINAMNDYCCLTKFHDALQLSGTESNLRSIVNKGPTTIFAWKDEVIEKLDPELYKCVTTGQGPKDILSQIVLYHIVTDGDLSAAEVASKQQLTSASGMLIDVKVVNGAVILDDYAVVVEPAVIKTTNVTVHLISEVLVPESILGVIESVCGSSAPASASLPTPGL